MQTQSFIEKLGFDATDKVVIFHIDDIGFSHSSNVASFHCLDFGVASCGSIIVPAPWFFEVASIYRNNPIYDLGVHLTLTCEYDLYRWRAMSSVDPNSGLLDSQNCLWHTIEEAIANITPKAAETEMRSQIQFALDNSIDITHLDTHMGTIMHPKFIQIYIKLGQEYNIPVFLPRISKEQLTTMGLSDYIDAFEKLQPRIELMDIPLIDHMIIDTLNEHPNKVEYYCKQFSEIKPGLTHFLFHPAELSPELEAITPESAHWRNQDYEAFIDIRIKECVEKYDLKIIGYRKIRDFIRNH